MTIIERYLLGVSLLIYYGLGGKGVKLLEEWNPHYSYKIQQRNNKWKTEELPRWLKTQEKES